MILRLCDESLNPLNASASYTLDVRMPKLVRFITPDSEHVISEVDVYSHSKYARVLFSSSYRKRERELAEHLKIKQAG